LKFDNSMDGSFYPVLVPGQRSRAVPKHHTAHCETKHRHDDSVNIAGGFGVAQLTSDYAQANGIRLAWRVLRAYFPDSIETADQASRLYTRPRSSADPADGLNISVSFT
jgi:hypothetical protein